jgi:hypothetical protein
MVEENSRKGYDRKRIFRCFGEVSSCTAGRNSNFQPSRLSLQSNAGEFNRSIDFFQVAGLLSGHIFHNGAGAADLAVSLVRRCALAWREILRTGEPRLKRDSGGAQFY